MKEKDGKHQKHIHVQTIGKHRNQEQIKYSNIQFPFPLRCNDLGLKYWHLTEMKAAKKYGYL